VLDRSGDRVSQGVAAGLMTFGTIGARVDMEMKSKSPNQAVEEMSAGERAWPYRVLLAAAIPHLFRSAEK
jgi:hypothetical protein